MIEASSDLVTLRKFPNLEEAQRAAGNEAANTGALSIPVVAFRQGRRTVVTGAMPMGWVRNRLESRSARAARKGGSMMDAKDAWNRPEIPEHSQVIAKYILDNHSKAYIIPPLSLNIQHGVHLYIPDYASEFLPGYLVIPGSARLAVTDGQHRKSGIALAMEQMDEIAAARFGGDAVAVMITCETDINQIHQDFADCSKTKPLPPSLLAVYDRRNPANRLVGDLEGACRLLNKRIDPTSKTLSKKSTFLFLANQLRQFVKELIAGTYAIADPAFEQRAEELLGQDSQYNAALSQFSEYVNWLTDAIPVWRDIAKLAPGSLEVSQIPLRREQGWVCLTATGLNIVGRVGHRLFTNADLRRDWKSYASKLGDPGVVDWRREAQIWQGNIVREGRLLTQQVPVRLAFKRVLEAIGIANDADPVLGAPASPSNSAEHPGEPHPSGTQDDPVSAGAGSQDGEPPAGHGSAAQGAL